MADPRELEQLAERLEASGDYRVLRRVPIVGRYAADDADAVKRRGLIVDVETTGLDPTQDRIIELALLPFTFSPDGVLYEVEAGYAGLEDPGMPLPEMVARLTGITDDEVRGQRLDDAVVAALAAQANLVIAHNAGFDRRFIERRFPTFVEQAWACSMEQVPWAEEGLRTRSLDYLLYRFGCFFDNHRGMTDCQALLHLLSLDLPLSGRPILQVLLEVARRPSWRFWALEAPFDLKDRLKARGYRWNGGEDGRPRAWFRDVDDAGRAEEERFLTEEIYGGQARHQAARIDFRNRFSDRE